jgi:hypothetical protein
MSAFASAVITKHTIAIFFQRKQLMMIKRYQFKVDNGIHCISYHREQVAGMYQTLSFVAKKRRKKHCFGSSTFYNTYSGTVVRRGFLDA